MAKLRNMVLSFGLMYGLFILYLTAWGGIQEGYGLEESNLQDGKNVFEKLSEIDLISGINEMGKGMLAFTKLGGVDDLVGALTISGFGILQVLGGIIAFPIQLFGVITGFYGNIIPPILIKIIGFTSVLYVGFILLKAKMGASLQD